MEFRHKVAIIDSGIGGLRVLKLCQKELGCDLVYIMDNAFCPYGEKEAKDIQQRVLYLCDKAQFEFGADAIILACNTATSVAVDIVRKTRNIPIIGMEPPILPALRDGNERIVIMSTEVTNRYNKLIQNFKDKKGIEIVSFKTLAKDIEENFFNIDILQESLKNSFSKETLLKCQAVVLGCSHFHYVESLLNQIFLQPIKFYHSDDGVVLRAKNLLNIKCNSQKGRIAIMQTKHDGKLLDICRSEICGN